MCKRVLNKRTNLGNKYFVNVYIRIVNKTKLKITWLTKKKGISCGIIYLIKIIQSSSAYWIFLFKYIKHNYV